MVGVGLTVTVYNSGVPAHVLAVGVMVMEAVFGAIPVLVAVNEGIFPVPDAVSPMAGSLFTHTNVVPAPTGLLMVVTGTLIVLQKTWSATGSTVGVGLTMIL
jgi:hypothetical protein